MQLHIGPCNACHRSCLVARVCDKLWVAANSSTFSFTWDMCITCLEKTIQALTPPINPTKE